MRATILLWTLALVGLTVAAPGHQTLHSPAIDITTILEEAIQRRELPAMGAAIVEADGTLTALAATGARARGSDARVTIADLWHIGSCTKSMTASLCALLVERGSLRWDSTLGEVFPDVADQMTEAYRAVTLEQLLSHRAGTPAGTGRRALWAAFWAHRGTPTEARRMALERITEEEPVHPPGTEHLYSNYGFALAGLICEEVTGEPFETLLLERLLAPLGIMTAGWGAPGSEGEVDQPRGHKYGRPVEPGPIADNPSVLSPAGRLHLSLADWAKYIAWHLRAGAGAEGELLTAPSFARLHTAQPESNYALGWGVAQREWAGRPALMHSGSNTMWYCVVWAAPKRGFAVLVATNEAGDAAAKGCDEVAWALIQQRLQRETDEGG